MTIGSHIQTFAGLPVKEFDPAAVDEARAVENPKAIAWRISQDYDAALDDWEPILRSLISTIGEEALTTLVIGDWGSSYESSPPIDALCQICAPLPNLRALFLGEITYDECEISWINQGDVTPLLRELPRLEVLWVRGAQGLDLDPIRHERLRELAFESGGLPAEVVQAVGECDFPALEHLELWLGTSMYGGDADVEDLAAILSGARLPALRYLGLRDAELADQVAAALASAPVVARLADLDLSLGVLSDVGVTALLAGQPLTHLKRLNLSHHFISDEMGERLRSELPDVDVDLSDQQESDTDDDEGHGRFVAVGE